MILEIILYLIGCGFSYMFCVGFNREVCERLSDGEDSKWWSLGIAVVFTIFVTLLSWLGMACMGVIKWSWNLQKYWFILK